MLAASTETIFLRLLCLYCLYVDISSMNQPLLSRTDVDTQTFARHESAIRDLTLNFAPNMRPPILTFGFPLSIVASWRDQSSIRACCLLRIDSHSPFRVRSQMFIQPPTTEVEARPLNHSAGTLGLEMWRASRASTPRLRNSA
jgi:hypothetical protein